VSQQVLQGDHGDAVPKETEHGELGAAAQGGQDGIKLGVGDLTLLQEQALQGAGQCL
jgi:hypothetical protein